MGGQQQRAGPAGTRRRVMFDDSTRFRDSTELLTLGVIRQVPTIPVGSGSTNGTEDTRGTVRSSRAQPGHTMAPLPGSTLASTISKGRGRPGTAGPTGRRAHKALEEAAEQAAQILAATTKPRPSSSTAKVAASATRGPSSSKVKYETKEGAGGGLFTFAATEPSCLSYPSDGAAA